MTPNPVPITIDNRLRLPLAALPDEVREALMLRCSYSNPARHKLERLARGASGKKRGALQHALRAEPATIVTWSMVGDALTLPRGALARVREELRAAGLGWSYIDARTRGTIAHGYLATVKHRPAPSSSDGGALRWYQEEASEAAIARQNCLLRAPTGSGKTSTLIGIVARLRLPTLIVVDSAELLRQWHGRLVAELGLAPEDIGQIGGGRDDIRPITLGMRQSLMRRAAGLSGAFGVVIVDEVHRAAANTFLGVVDAFASRYRIGASADETRADGKEFLVYDAFGDVAHEVTREELITSGDVLDVECRIIPTDFRADWYVAQRDSGSPDFNRLLDEMTADATRNLLVTEAAAAEVAAGEQVLVLTHRVEHAQRLSSSLTQGGSTSDVMLGGVEWAERRSAAIDAMRAGLLRVACGTIQSIGTGVDLPSVGRGVLATPIGANRQLYGQIRGRLCRPAEGKSAVIFVLWDQYVSGAAPLRRMLDWNRSVVVRATTGWVDGRAYLKQWKEQNHA